MADTGYTISVRPTNLVVGEEFTVEWTVPLDTFTFDDWLGIFLFGSLAQDPINWKYAAFRAGNTVFDAPEERGDYECRYFEWNFFGGSRQVAKSAMLNVRKSVENPRDIKNYPPRGRAIVAFGDSLVFGQGAPQGKDFPSELGRRLGKPIINAGMIGDTTESALKRLTNDVLAKNPRIVIILLGGNDILQGKSPTVAIENLKKIILIIQRKRAAVILVGVQGGLFTDRLRDGFHNLADETKVAFVPNVLRGIIGNIFLLSNPVHPNEKGYQLVADRIFPAVLALDTAPKPEAVIVNNQLKITWEVLQDSDYRLLTKTNLNDPVFIPITASFEKVGERISVSVPIDKKLDCQFFQLEEVE